MMTLAELERLPTDDRQRLMGRTSSKPSQEMAAVAKAPRPTIVTITVLDAHGAGGRLLSFESPATAKGALRGLGCEQSLKSSDWIAARPR